MNGTVDDGEFSHARVLHAWLVRKGRPTFSEFVKTFVLQYERPLDADQRLWPTTQTLFWIRNVPSFFSPQKRKKWLHLIRHVCASMVRKRMRKAVRMIAAISRPVSLWSFLRSFRSASDNLIVVAFNFV